MSDPKDTRSDDEVRNEREFFEAEQLRRMRLVINGVEIQDEYFNDDEPVREVKLQDFKKHQDELRRLREEMNKKTLEDIRQTRLELIKIGAIKDEK